MPTHCHLGASSCGLSPCTAPFPPGTRVCLARLGPFGKLLVQMRRFCRDKMPKAGGQGTLGSGRRPGSDVACGSGAEVLVPRETFPSWPSVWGPLCPTLWGPPHPSSDSLGTASTPPAGSLLRLGWELPALVQATTCLRVPCGWGLCQLQAPTVHPEGARPRPQPPTQRPHGGDATGMALVRQVRQVSGWQGRQPDRWTDGTSQPPLHGSRGQRAPGRDRETDVTVRWCGHLRCEEPRTGRLWAPRAPGVAPRREADWLTNNMTQLPMARGVMAWGD